METSCDAPLDLTTSAREHRPKRATRARLRATLTVVLTLLALLAVTLTATPAAAVRLPTNAAPTHRPTSDQLTLPRPTGPHRIGTVSLHLVDRARTDPWLPSHPARELMVQIWYPAARDPGYPPTPWLSAGAVPYFERSIGVAEGALRWPTTHARLGAPLSQSRRGRPVVLYSPGLGSDRVMNTTLVEELASHGYIVVTIDHTHDAGEVEFPDGRVETGALPREVDESVIAQALAVRVADSRFVLDQLAVIEAGGNPDAGARPLPTGSAGAFDLSRTGMFGHSLGGATAAATMHADRRVAAGVNLDGSLLRGRATAGSDRPFLLVGSDQAGAEDPDWDEFWDNQRGWKRELLLTGSTHISFTDFEVLFPQAGPLVGLTPEQIVHAIGTLDPARAVRAQRAYLRAFFDLHLRKRGSQLLDRVSPRYPEVHIVR